MKKEIRYFVMEILLFFRGIIKNALKIISVVLFLLGCVFIAIDESGGFCFVISIISFVLRYLYDRLIFAVCPDGYNLYLED